MEKYKIDFSSIPWQSPVPGGRFKTYLEGDRRLSLVEFSREYADIEWCTRGHIGYVLAGEGELDFNGRIVRIAVGDGVFIPPGLNHKHKIKALSDVITVVYVGEV
jgi:hypothetical protein